MSRPDWPGDIHTTNGELFTQADHGELARLIWKRFGRDFAAAAAAWRRLLENKCDEQGFRELVALPPAPEPAKEKTG